MLTHEKIKWFPPVKGREYLPTPEHGTRIAGAIDFALSKHGYIYAWLFENSQWSVEPVLVDVDAALCPGFMVPILDLEQFAARVVNVVEALMKFTAGTAAEKYWENEKQILLNDVAYINELCADIRAIVKENAE